MHSAIFYTEKSNEMCKEVFLCTVTDQYSESADPQVRASDSVSGRNSSGYWLHLKKEVLHPVTVIMLTNKSVVVLTGLD